jgi:hypothetical protein
MLFMIFFHKNALFTLLIYFYGKFFFTICNFCPCKTLDYLRCL